MSAATIRERILDNLRVRLPGAIDSAIKLELFNVLDELCRDARLWREKISLTVTAANITAEKVEYEVDPSDGVIVGLMDLRNSDDIPVKGSMDIPGVLEFDEVPGTADTFEVTVALAPSDIRTSDDMPVIEDWIWEKHYQTIIAGVLSNMMAQAAKPYSNERLGVYHGRKFRGGVASARTEALHSHKYGGQTWRFPHFARGGR